MNAVQQTYIRFSDISEKTHLTQGDVLDAIESGQLSLYAAIDIQNAATEGGSRKLRLNNRLASSCI